MTATIIHGDCLDVLRGMADGSVDAVVTDPPYELAFMGRKWDASGIAYSVDLWREVLRVLKPGGHLLAFGGTRTYHRMTCAIEDAGAEIRDCITWHYGQGFPKSHNIGGGLGTALKPSTEPIVVARKPLVGTVAANVERFGTGAINVDACRVNPGDTVPGGGKSKRGNGGVFGDGIAPANADPHTAGRWPPNLLLTHSADCVRVGERSVKATAPHGPNARAGSIGFGGSEGQAVRAQDYGSKGTETVLAYDCADDCPVAMMDRQSGDLHGAGHANSQAKGRGIGMGSTANDEGRVAHRFGDSGGASRFFPTFDAEPFLYQAKASKRDRGEGNRHPTVKPTALMQWLVRLVTPPGGTILDPFAGSGTTLVAALAERRQAIGIEREADYVEIIKARLAKAEAA